MKSYKVLLQLNQLYICVIILKYNYTKYNKLKLITYLFRYFQVNLLNEYSSRVCGKISVSRLNDPC